MCSGQLTDMPQHISSAIGKVLLPEAHRPLLLLLDVVDAKVSHTHGQIYTGLG